MHSICSLSAFVPHAYRSLDLGKARSGSGNNLSWSVGTSCGSVLSRMSKWKRYSFIRFLSTRATVQVTFRTNTWITLHNPRSYFNSGTFIGCFSRRMASVAWHEMVSSLNFLMWPRSSISSSEKKPFFSYNETPVLGNSPRTEWRWEGW